MSLTDTSLRKMNSLFSIAHATHEEGRATRDAHYTVSLMLFASWDYSLTDRDAAKNLSSGIANNLRVN